MRHRRSFEAGDSGRSKVEVEVDGARADRPRPASMGLATWAAFAGSDERASIDGAFAMTPGEVQPVLRALRETDIHVVALHNHMIDKEPAFYFVHFWAKGPAKDLAEGFRAALDAQKDATGAEER